MNMSKYGISDLITIIPGLPINQSTFVMKNSLASISFYETSNLGNVFLESISYGVPVIAENCNGSLNYFPDDILKVNGRKYEDLKKTIEYAYLNKEKLDLIRNSALKFAERISQVGKLERI